MNFSASTVCFDLIVSWLSAFWMNEPNFARYQAGGALAPLPGGVDTSAFPAPLMKSYNVDGKQFGLPWTAVTIGLWFNKKVFDAAKVGYPDDTHVVVSQLRRQSRGCTATYRGANVRDLDRERRHDVHA